MLTLLKKIFVVASLLLMTVCFNEVVSADSNDFSIMPILPENQNPDVPSYFDLTVIPSQKQKLQVQIKNNSNENQKYRIYVNTATTNQNGIIDYSISDFEKDESMKIYLKDCITLEENQVEVSANSEKTLSFELSVPEEVFEGILLGGITIEPIVEEGKKSVNNVFTRTIAIQLSETTSEIVPKLEGGKVSVSQENLRNNIKFELRNSTPIIISKVRAEIAITKQGVETPVLEQTKEQLSFAPNSKFNLMTEWNNQFKPGKYMYSIHLNDEKGNKWDFNQEFEIKSEVAEKLNEKSVDEKKSSIQDYLIYIIGVLTSIFIGFVIWMVSKRLKKHKQK
ncbi:DUF916 and DUF3324 domain-containing protein [Listeria welshimeri]|nr:DUF916 and DUF3324 domain-containing protein [Listeria welshimeri]